jgi:GDPmannose 4,6-dehydratase
VLNPTHLRPLDITFSSANPAKAERLLGWKATKKMREVVTSLVDAEREGARGPA